jgi:hypothetical protein
VKLERNKRNKPHSEVVNGYVKAKERRENREKERKRVGGGEKRIEGERNRERGR